MLVLSLGLREAVVKSEFALALEGEDAESELVADVGLDEVGDGRLGKSEAFGVATADEFAIAVDEGEGDDADAETGALGRGAVGGDSTGDEVGREGKKLVCLRTSLVIVAVVETAGGSTGAACCLLSSAGLAAETLALEVAAGADLFVLLLLALLFDVVGSALLLTAVGNGTELEERLVAAGGGGETALEREVGN